MTLERRRKKNKDELVVWLILEMYDKFNITVCVCVSPFDRALEVWLADGVVVYEDCGTGAVLL